MQTLDWGIVTPESANLNTNTFAYVYNHDLSSSEKIDRTIRFIVCKLLYYDNHLPKDPINKVKIDIRGQQIGEESCGIILRGIKLKYPRPEALVIEFVK